MGKKQVLEFKNSVRNADYVMRVDDVQRYMDTYLYGHLLRFNNVTDINLKIPAISHHLWITNPEKPKITREVDIAIARQSISKMDEDLNYAFKHYIWTNCRECLTFKDTNIEVRDFESISTIRSYKIIQKLLREAEFGPAVDMLKYEVANLYGGIVLDLNYKLFTSPILLMSKTHFLIEEFSNNSVFASTPGHPIIECAISKSIKNYETSPTEFSDLDTWNNLGLCHRLLANQNGRIDVTIPPTPDTFAKEKYTPPSPITLEEHLENILGKHFVQKLQCTTYDFSIGVDGKDGRTWSGKGYKLQDLNHNIIGEIPTVIDLE